MTHKWHKDLFQDDHALQEKLPSAMPDGEPLPEGLLWLLLTGDVSLCSCFHTQLTSYANSALPELYILFYLVSK